LAAAGRHFHRADAPPAHRSNSTSNRAAKKPRRSSRGLRRKPPYSRRQKKPATKKPVAKKPVTKKPAPSLKQDPKANPDKPKAPAKKPVAKKPVAKKLAPKPPTKLPSAKTPPTKLPGTPGKTLLAGKKPPIKLTKPAPPPKKKVVRMFKGNSASQDFLQNIGKLRAIRSLGVLEAAKLEEFGLKDSKTKLTIASGASKRVFIVGKRTHGNSDYYIKDTSDKRVYVIKQTVLQDLRYTEFRLMDRRLQTFDLKDVERVQITANGRRKVLMQHNRHKSAKARWTDEGKEIKDAKPLYRAWMTKLSRSRALEYTSPKKPPKARELLTVTFYRGSRKLGATTILAASKSALTATKGPAQTFYAVSAHTRVPVTINPMLANEIARDVGKILGE
jgi:hypothetical protein